MVVIAALLAHAWVAGRLAGMLSLSVAGIAAGAIALVIVAVHLLGARRR